MYGHLPLPPYIDRGQHDYDSTQAQQKESSYQPHIAGNTNYGSLAAPTATLHFTPAIFERLETI